MAVAVDIGKMCSIDHSYSKNSSRFGTDRAEERLNGATRVMFRKA